MSAENWEMNGCGFVINKRTTADSEVQKVASTLVVVVNPNLPCKLVKVLFEFLTCLYSASSLAS